MLAGPTRTPSSSLPWRGDDAPVARMFCDIAAPRRRRRSRATRATCCKRNLERAREQGFTFYVGPEMEFFYFALGRRDARCRSTTAGYFDLTAADVAQRPAQADDPTLEAMGIPVEYSHPRGRARASTRSTCATPTR